MSGRRENRRPSPAKAPPARGRIAELERANERLSEQVAALERERDSIQRELTQTRSQLQAPPNVLPDSIPGEQQVLESRQRYEDLINNMSDIIYSTSREGIVLSINQAM